MADNPPEMKTICVVGLGYIGLPTASMFATQGFQVLGVDTNANVVEVLNKGGIHIEEPGLNTLVQAATHSGRLRAALRPEPCDVYILALPTPVHIHDDGRKVADLGVVRQGTESICPVLKSGDLVVLESTVPPGTTRDLVAGTIRRKTGLEPGKNLHVAHCPERVLPGRILRELIANDRVIGGLTPRCAELAANLYQTFVEGACHLTDTVTAEMAKLMENTFRDVNIALANELAAIAEVVGFDANEVIDLANCHPRVNLHRPGLGVGGHCIPVDPWFVVEVAPDRSPLISLARRINEERPKQVVEILSDRLGEIEGRSIAVLGLAYKGNVDDIRESPAVELVGLLNQAGAAVRAYDPRVKHAPNMELCGLNDTLDGADIALITSGHDEFGYLDPAVVRERMKRPMIYDLVGVLKPRRWLDAGFAVWKVGRSD